MPRGSPVLLNHMRWSAGHSHNSHLYEVWLDGVRQPLAIAADAELGYVESWRTDKQGQILRNSLNGRGERETRYGEVELRRVNDDSW